MHEVFQDWRNAVIIPVPEKSNLQSCGKRISLLDAVKKILCHIFQ